jgi:hypothetical protein
MSGSWAFSPDRRLLALGRYEEVGDGFWEAKGFVRLVDPRAMKRVADIPLGAGPLEGSPMAWIVPDRIVALARNCCTGDSDLVVVDPVARRLLERRPLHADPIRTLRAGEELVVLAAPHTGIGPVSVLAIDAEGQVRSVVLDRIEGGRERTGEGSDVGVNALLPALAVQPEGGQAFVFSPGGLAAEIDLATLAVTYHSLAQAARTPAARQKRYTGSSAWAEQVGQGLVALTGSSTQPYIDANGNEQFKTTPAGLVLVDVRDWSARRIDSKADSFALASDKALTEDPLLAAGSSGDSGTSGEGGNGITAYTVGGRKVFRIFKGQPAFVNLVYGTRIFVSLYEGPLRVVSLGSHRVVGTRDHQTLPWLITP